jgi:uncharacterized protein
MLQDTSEAVTLIREGYEAYRRKDLAAILALLDPEIELYQSELVPWGGTYRGHAGAQAFFGKLLAHVDSEVDPDQLLDAGDRVVAVGRSRGRVRATGAPFDVAAVHVWTLRDRMALRFESYLDTPAMLRALAAPPPPSAGAGS